MKIEKFNDALALIAVVLILAFWSAIGLGWLAVPGEVVGASITILTTVIYFYFRKSPPTDTTGTTPTE